MMFGKAWPGNEGDGSAWERTCRERPLIVLAFMLVTARTKHTLAIAPFMNLH